MYDNHQGCIFRLTCSNRELIKDHVLTSAYVKIFRTLTRNAVNKSVWRKKDCSWLPLNKHAMNIWLSTLRIRAHLKLENRKTSSCSPRAPNLFHVLPSRMVGWHNLCSPEQATPGYMYCLWIGNTSSQTLLLLFSQLYMCNVWGIVFCTLVRSNTQRRRRKKREKLLDDLTLPPLTGLANEK